MAVIRKYHPEEIYISGSTAACREIDLQARDYYEAMGGKFSSKTLGILEADWVATDQALYYVNYLVDFYQRKEWGSIFSVKIENRRSFRGLEKVSLEYVEPEGLGFNYSNLKKQTFETGKSASEDLLIIAGEVDLGDALSRHMPILDLPRIYLESAKANFDNVTNFKSYNEQLVSQLKQLTKRYVDALTESVQMAEAAKIKYRKLDRRIRDTVQAAESTEQKIEIILTEVSQMLDTWGDYAHIKPPKINASDRLIEKGDFFSDKENRDAFFHMIQSHFAIHLDPEEWSGETFRDLAVFIHDHFYRY